MKIRWTRGSVRLRITPPELEGLLRGDPVEETLRFAGAASWRATLEAAAETQLRIDGESLILSLSAPDRARLADEQAEGVYFTEDGFRYFVEKDFPCAHPRGAEALEPPTVTFEPPPGFEERKN